MTRKDFEAIAAAVNSARESHVACDSHIACDGHKLLDQTAELLALHLASTNPRFDATRFLTACGNSPFSIGRFA
jgi:hypothetical protein